MSSETLLFESTWGEGNKVHKLVARLAPTDQDIPVFPYDLSSQVKVMKLRTTHGYKVPKSYGKNHQ